LSTDTDVDQFFAGGGAAPAERVNGRYKMVGPDGDQHSYQTASNFGFPLADQFGLNKWRMRQLLTGVAMRPDLQALLATMDTAEPDRGKLDEVIDTALQVAGTTADANRGTAVHSVLQAADEGKAYPPEYSSYVDYYREALAHFGLRVVLTERLVVAPELGAAGRLDRVFEEADGTLVIGDVKTSGRLDLGAHEISVQLAVYQGASHVRGDDGKSWISLRDGRRVRDDYAIVVHVDKDTGAVAMYRVDLIIGRHGANLAEQVRGWRKSGPVLLPYVPPLGAGPNTVDPATVAQAASAFVQAAQPEPNPTTFPNGAPDPFTPNPTSFPDGTPDPFDQVTEQTGIGTPFTQAAQPEVDRLNAQTRQAMADAVAVMQGAPPSLNAQTASPWVNGPGEPNEAADMFGGPAVTGPPVAEQRDVTVPGQVPGSATVPGMPLDPFGQNPVTPARAVDAREYPPTAGLFKTSTELMKMSKAEVQQYCREHGNTGDLAHTKKVLVEMLAKAGKLAAPGSQPTSDGRVPATSAHPDNLRTVPPSETPGSDVFRQLQLGRIKAAATVGDLQTLNRAIVTKHGDQAWTDELTEAARLRVAELDATHPSAATVLERIASAQRPEDLAKLWEEITVGNSAPGAWTPEIHQAANARMVELNNARPPAPANPFAGG
jgi:hypothetical protein